MNFLRKILLVAVAFVFVGNAEGAVHSNLPPPASKKGANVVDFDTIANVSDNIPAMFQPKIYEPEEYRNDNPNNNLRYVYFTVINNAANAPATTNFQAASVQRPISATEYNIYFPADGHQPTTLEAVKYSCANVDKYNINSPITEWYMRMFGWIPEDDTVSGASHDDSKRLKAGFDAENENRSPIFVMPLGLVGNDHIFLQNHISLTKRQSFWYFFRFVASSPVGRVLLYRLLIEVNRFKDRIENGATEKIILTPVELIKRNERRKLEIEWRNDGNAFSLDKPRLGFCSTNILALQCIAKIDEKANGVWIIPYSSWYAPYVDISLFHELCHWFHFLRNPVRYYLERTAGGNWIALNGRNFDQNKKNKLEIPFAEYIWGSIFSSSWKVSALPWRAEKHVNFEEIRNIVGSEKGLADYLEGDDLSENLYRLSVGQPLRFGHSNEIYFESISVIEISKIR